ncbi:MAG: prefoldin subunit beta [Candidatus Aenigmatarchaeota archaeon]
MVTRKDFLTRIKPKIKDLNLRGRKNLFSDFMEVTEETKNLLAQFQAYQQQLQTILIQKESAKIQVMETEKALEELNQTKEKNAYKISGQIMVLKPVEELKKELSEIKEDLEIRIKALEKSEEKIKDKLKDLQSKLKDVLK